MSKSIINKAMRGKYRFPKSKTDIQVLRELKEGNIEKRESEYYAAALNICTEFGEQMLDNIVLLNDFNNHVVDMSDEYQPSGPPMSPVSTSFFTTWLTFDALINKRLTIGIIYLNYIREKKAMLYAEKAIEYFTDSYCSFYQVVGGDLKETVLWDIIEKREIEGCLSIVDYSLATYNPEVGDVWYARVLPSLINDENPYVVFGTPLIFRKTGRDLWEDFFSRRRASIGNGADIIRNYLKHGDSFGYWLEFVFQTYAGHTREVIYAEGLPDIIESRPHGELDRGVLS